MSFIANTISSQTSALKGFLDNNYVSGGIQLFIILYATLAAPQLPVSMAKLFHVPAFQLVLFALIAYTATKDIGVSVMLAIAFFVSFQTYQRHQIATTAAMAHRATTVHAAAAPVAQQEQEQQNHVPSYVQYAHLDTNPVEDALNREARDNEL
jgi:hypothetical protein